MEIFTLAMYLETLKYCQQATSLAEEIKVKIIKYTELSTNRNAPNQDT